MSKRQRCSECRWPMATEEDKNTVPQGEDAGLCWASMNRHGHRSGPPPTQTEPLVLGDLRIWETTTGAEADISDDHRITSTILDREQLGRLRDWCIDRVTPPDVQVAVSPEAVDEVLAEEDRSEPPPGYQVCLAEEYYPENPYEPGAGWCASAVVTRRPMGALDAEMADEGEALARAWAHYDTITAPLRAEVGTWRSWAAALRDLLWDPEKFVVTSREDITAEVERLRLRLDKVRAELAEVTDERDAVVLDLESSRLVARQRLLHLRDASQSHMAENERMRASWANALGTECTTAGQLADLTLQLRAERDSAVEAATRRAQRVAALEQRLDRAVSSGAAGSVDHEDSEPRLRPSLVISLPKAQAQPIWEALPHHVRTEHVCIVMSDDGELPDAEHMSEVRVALLGGPTSAVRLLKWMKLLPGDAIVSSGQGPVATTEPSRTEAQRLCGLSKEFDPQGEAQAAFDDAEDREFTTETPRGRQQVWVVRDDDEYKILGVLLDKSDAQELAEKNAADRDIDVDACAWYEQNAELIELYDGADIVASIIRFDLDLARQAPPEPPGLPEGRSFDEVWARKVEKHAEELADKLDAAEATIESLTKEQHETRRELENRTTYFTGLMTKGSAECSTMRARAEDAEQRAPAPAGLPDGPALEKAFEAFWCGPQMDMRRCGPVLDVAKRCFAGGMQAVQGPHEDYKALPKGARLGKATMLGEVCWNDEQGENTAYFQYGKLVCLVKAGGAWRERECPIDIARAVLTQAEGSP